MNVYSKFNFLSLHKTLSLIFHTIYVIHGVSSRTPVLVLSHLSPEKYQIPSPPESRIRDRGRDSILTEWQHVYSILNVLMKQNLSMPPCVVQILDLRLFQSKAASGTFVLIKFLQGTSLSQEMNWIVNWILGKQTESANIQILNSVISKMRSYKYSKDRPEKFV